MTFAVKAILRYHVGISLPRKENDVPIYQYKCDHCGNETEKMVPRYDSPPPRCTECAEGAVMRQRLTAPAGFFLKGEGFYKPTRGV